MRLFGQAGPDGVKRYLSATKLKNHQFSTYSTRIEASVWKENERVIDLFAEDKSIEPFDRVTVEWTLSGEELESAGFWLSES